MQFVLKSWWMFALLSGKRVLNLIHQFLSPFLFQALAYKHNIVWGRQTKMITVLINECRASENEPIPNNFTSARGPPLRLPCSVLFCHPKRPTKLCIRRALGMQPRSHVTKISFHHLVCSSFSLFGNLIYYHNININNILQPFWNWLIVYDNSNTKKINKLTRCILGKFACFCRLLIFFF